MKVDNTLGTYYTNTVNGVTKTMPCSDSSEFFLNKDPEGRKAFCVGLPDGKNYRFLRKEDSADSIYVVTEYDRNQKIGEVEIDASKVDAHNATHSEMIALALYTDDAGYTNDFCFHVGSALTSMAGVDNQAAYTDVRLDYYKELQFLMRGNMRSESWKYYLSLKSFFDFYDNKSVGVPTFLL